jgi:hypothetical protein
MRISSIIRSRSGVVLFSFMETSCPLIEKAPIVEQVQQITKSAAVRSSWTGRNKRHCRASGLVLPPNPYKMLLSEA